jgi:hypothetical protein
MTYIPCILYSLFKYLTLEILFNLSNKKQSLDFCCEVKDRWVDIIMKIKGKLLLTKIN